MATTSTKPTTPATKAAKATTPATGTPVAASAPVLPAAPVNPLAPTATWALAAGPAPAKARSYKAGTVPGVVVGLCGQGTPGATMAMLQAAINQLGLQGAHPAYSMLTYGAKHWGWHVQCTNGVVTITGA